MKNDNLPSFLKNQQRIQPAAPRGLPKPYDSFYRPADGVSIEEWRIMICSIAGSFRVSQGFTKGVTLVQNQVVEVAQNDKSYALFVQVNLTADPAGIDLIAGGQSNLNIVTGISFRFGVSQVLLPGESLYILLASVGPKLVTVTEVTV